MQIRRPEQAARYRCQLAGQRPRISNHTGRELCAGLHRRRRPPFGPAEPTPGRLDPALAADAMLGSEHFSNAADLWGDVMKFVVEFGCPPEPFNPPCLLGHRRKKIGELPGAVEARSST